jgi:membrane protease YdiL (CAAX protease family)
VVGPSPSPAARSTAVPRYLVAVGVLIVSITSQYFVPFEVPAVRPIYGSLAGDVAIVYGIPILAFALLVGAGPLRGWSARMSRAVPYGLGWFGAMSILAVGVTLALALVYAAADPAALRLLERPNPALQAAAGDPWFFVGFSFAVGAFEETLFRGWVFGFWAGHSASWLGPAVLSSALFAGLHLYYGTTYGVAAPLIFPTLFLLGFAFAATYRTAGGNLVVPAALHGAYDAAGYLTLVSLAAGTDLHWALVLIGAVVGLALYLRVAPGPPAPSPGTGGPVGGR